jgi:hypothetical protein
VNPSGDSYDHNQRNEDDVLSNASSCSTISNSKIKNHNNIIEGNRNQSTIADDSDHDVPSETF